MARFGLFSNADIRISPTTTSQPPLMPQQLDPPTPPDALQPGPRIDTGDRVAHYVYVPHWKICHAPTRCHGAEWPARHPRECQIRLGMPDGGNFIVHVEDGHIRLEPIPSAVARAQAIVRRYVPEDVSLVDELTEDRRREAEGE